MAGSKVAATIRTWFQTKCKQANSMSDSQKASLKVIAAVTVVGLVYSYGCYSCAIFVSQAAQVSDKMLKEGKRRKTLYQAIGAGIVSAIFDYDSIDDTHSGSENYLGHFHGNLQYGSYYDTVSQTWGTCWRRIVRIKINDKYLKVPRALLSALGDGSVVVDRHGKLELYRLNSPVKHAGLHHVLESQSGMRSYMKSRKESEQLTSDAQAKTQLKQPSIVVHAGAHHTARWRSSNSESSPWSMNNIFYDTNTVKADIKFLKDKFADEQRNHFAATGSATCDSKQVTPLQGLMKEMKISTVSSDGFSVQESTSVAPVPMNDDIGV